MTVRGYLSSDRAAVRKICLETAGAAKADESVQRFILSLYCDYYIENEPESCFVLADENDEAVGYILCSSDFKRYKKGIRPYIKKIRRISLKYYLTAVAGEIGCALFAKKYKAHLHIDILPEYTRMGAGTRLLDTLFSRLRDLEVGGLQLGVSAANKGAVEFYKKNSFKIKANFVSSYIMTKDL